MTDVIDLAAERDKRFGPDPEFVTVVDGEKWYVFCLSYTDAAGRNYGFRIWAKDFVDAEQRLAAIKATAVVDGKLYSEIPD